MLPVRSEAVVVVAAVPASPPVYSHLPPHYHIQQGSNELQLKARAGRVEFERQAIAQATGSMAAASWVSSVEVSSHYIGLESVGSERMALIFRGRHPDAPYKQYMLPWLARNLSC